VRNPLTARRATAFAVGLAALASGPAGSRAALPPAPAAPHVTVITDSVGGVLFWAKSEREQLGEGIDLQLETKTCRKLVSPGCFAYDEVPPSALQTVQQLGSSVGPVVVVDVGYNDFAEGYAAGLDTLMGALRSAGVRQVVWVTLAENEPAWAQINAQIRAATARWPQLTVADWAPVIAQHPEWLVDHAHMNELGAAGFSRFLRPFLVDAAGLRAATPRPEVVLLAPTVKAHRARLRWRGDRYARAYEVAVRRAGGAWRIAAERAAGNSTLVDGIAGVRMEARVRALDASGLAGPWSQPRTFRL
jgi:hypothetical protein